MALWYLHSSYKWHIHCGRNSNGTFHSPSSWSLSVSVVIPAMFHIRIRNLDTMYKITEIMGIKTVDTTLFLVTTATCFDPKG